MSAPAEGAMSAPAEGAMSAAARDPSRDSYYVDAALYDRLMASFAPAAWQDESRLVADPAIRDAATALVLRDARYLDDRRYDDWLALFTPECIYWVPASPGGDPRREVAMCFDDRRMLEGRLYRLRTGYAWSQIPASRTTHLLSNIEVFAVSESDVVMVRANLLVAEVREAARVLAGWCAYRLEKNAAGWRIAVRQVNLLECDRNLVNPSLIV